MCLCVTCLFFPTVLCLLLLLLVPTTPTTHRFAVVNLRGLSSGHALAGPNVTHVAAVHIKLPLLVPRLGRRRKRLGSSVDSG